MKTLVFDLDGTLTILSEFPDLRLLIPKQDLLFLKGFYSFGLVTASPKMEALKALRQLSIYSLFERDIIITSEDTAQGKESGEPFLLAKSRAVSIVAMIGDSTADQTGSSIAGIPFISAQTLSVERLAYW